MKSKDSSLKNNRNGKYGLIHNQFNLNKIGSHTNNTIKVKEAFNSLKKLKETAKRRFMKKYVISKTFYNTKCISDIIFNEKSLLVAKFKDYLILDDTSEFLKRFYKKSEQVQRLKKIFDYYNECSKIFPNYIALLESKYIYKNIQRKQRMIDNLQNNEAKNKKGKKVKETNNKEEGLNSNVFDTRIINSIGELSTSKFDLNETGILDSSIYRKMVKGLNTKCLKETTSDINIIIKKSSLNLNNNSIDSLNSLVKLIDNKGKIKLKLLKNTSFKTPKILLKEDSGNGKLVHKTTNNFLNNPTNKYIKDLETIKVNTIEETNEKSSNENYKEKDFSNNETQTHSRKSSVINDLSKLKKLQINFIEPVNFKVDENHINKGDNNSLYNNIQIPLFQSTKNSSNVNIDYLYGKHQSSATGNIGGNIGLGMGQGINNMSKLNNNQLYENMIDSINPLNNLTTSRNSNFKKSTYFNENDVKNLDFNSINSSLNTNLINTLYSSNKKNINQNFNEDNNLNSVKSSLNVHNNQIVSNNNFNKEIPKDDNKTVYYIINQISNNNHNYYNYNINPNINIDKERENSSNKTASKTNTDSRNKNVGIVSNIMNINDNDSNVKKSIIMPDIKLNSSKIKLNAEIVLSNLKDGKLVETSKNIKSKNKVLFYDNGGSTPNNENLNKNNKKLIINEMVNNKSNKIENITPKNKSYVRAIIDDLKNTQSKFKTIDVNSGSGLGSGSKKLVGNSSNKDLNVNKFIRSSNDYYNLDNNDLKNTIKNFYMKSTSQGFNPKDIKEIENIHQKNINMNSNNTNNVVYTTKVKNMSSKAEKTTSNFVKTHYKTNSAL